MDDIASRIYSDFYQKIITKLKFLSQSHFASPLPTCKITDVSALSLLSSELTFSIFFSRTLALTSDIVKTVKCRIELEKKKAKKIAHRAQLHDGDTASDLIRCGTNFRANGWLYIRL